MTQTKLREVMGSMQFTFHSDSIMTRRDVSIRHRLKFIYISLWFYYDQQEYVTQLGEEANLHFTLILLWPIKRLSASDMSDGFTFHSDSIMTCSHLRLFLFVVSIYISLWFYYDTSAGISERNECFIYISLWFYYDHPLSAHR